jgi:hypothetical protein
MLFCSLAGNSLGPEGGNAIAEALKVNKSVQIIKKEFIISFFQNSKISTFLNRVHAVDHSF